MEDSHQNFHDRRWGLMRGGANKLRMQHWNLRTEMGLPCRCISYIKQKRFACQRISPEDYFLVARMVTSKGRELLCWFKECYHPILATMKLFEDRTGPPVTLQKINQTKEVFEGTWPEFLPVARLVSSRLTVMLDIGKPSLFQESALTMQSTRGGA